MSRNISSADNFFSTKINHNIGEQPRKLMARKNKKMKFFERIDNEADDIEMDKHRQSYKRAANKYSSRVQLHLNEINF